MMGNAADDWSPADNPYAIAVSEAGWWVRAVQLTARRLGRDDEQMLPYSSRQIDGGRSSWLSANSSSPSGSSRPHSRRCR
jgi:hypothetical protein